MLAIAAVLLTRGPAFPQDTPPAAAAPSALHRIDPQTPAGLQELFRRTDEPLPLVSGHRGGPQQGFPENCIATFENTLRQSFAIMECDPRYTKDGAIVLMHDPNLERTTTGRGPVAAATLAELKQLKLKDPEGGVTEFRIPTLDEALKWARGRTILVLDQKDVPVAARVKAIEAHHAEAYAMLIVGSFEDARACHAMNTNLMMEVMIPTREKAAEFDKTGVPWRNIVAFVGHTPPHDPKLYEWIHGKGASCIVGSSRNLDRRFLDKEVADLGLLEQDYRTLLLWGADLIETDLPGPLGHLLYGPAIVMSAREKYFCDDDIARLLRRVNAWQLMHPVMKPNDRNWERATWYTGVMAANRATGDETFFMEARDWGLQHQWAVGTEKAGANRLFCVETWAELYFLEKDPAMIRPAVEWLATAASNSPAGAKVWYLEGGRRYADSLYGASALAMLAKATGDQKYLDTLHAFFWDVQAELFDKEDGLFYRDQRFIGQHTKNGKKVYWSRGNGWVLGGIVRVLEYLPADDPQRPRYVELLRTMSAAIAKRQGADGLWRPNLDDADDVPAPESSGTGFFCYGMAWGIRHGLLDRETYLPVVRKAWAGLARCVTPDGQVQWGQPVGDRPATVTEALTHEYVTGAFLLAGSEMLELAKPPDLKP